eukprot:CAMPEP_0175012290 /NCGR_PEP_ID=MMETSP0005-20121125/9221_1 /TAXON_ID=420556 /ORGANISM="Ochromonas sp., Strain CCMP1393" /LENGTH=161 /DNA_ID=CAMNT_0016268499 /DNA_START=501 /DNA_END=986 /DNA_ORIENTATION=+
MKRTKTEIATYQINNKKDGQQTENCGNVAVKKKIPRWALLNGLFQGAVPDELARLNQYERNLIALICPITMVRLHNKGFHKSISRTYTVVNEIRFASTVLPRYDAGNQYVLLKYNNGNKKKMAGFQIRPSFVVEALRWKKDNDARYANIQISETNLEHVIP